MKMFLAFVKNFIFNNRKTNAALEAQLMQQRGYGFSADKDNHILSGGENINTNNELENYFDNGDHKLIWKWRHYFEIYEKHFSEFRNKSITLMEVGVYLGGSLEMWKHYFGDQCSILGVDIDPECKLLESEGITVLIGDQTDAVFWENVTRDHPPVDILIDDGGHKTNQQITTFENMLMHIKPGGIYLCEDIHGSDNLFLDYLFGLAKSLNHSLNHRAQNLEHTVYANSIQQRIGSINFYPYVVVVKLNDQPVEQFDSARKGG